MHMTCKEETRGQELVSMHLKQVHQLMNQIISFVKLDTDSLLYVIHMSFRSQFR